MPLPKLPFLLAAAARVAFALGTSACDSPPSASSLHEWTPADHDRSEETARAATQSPAPPPKGSPSAAPKGPDPVVEASWAQQCAACHGNLGHGDGPTGPMVHAADLTLPAWQATVTDDQIAASIRNGKGKMPPFPNLPPQIIAGFVGRIRALRGR